MFSITSSSLKRVGLTFLRMMSNTSNTLDSVTQFLDFINKSPTAFHCVNNITSILKNTGFQELKENEQWNVEKFGKYYVTKSGSCLAAFAVGEQYKHGNGFALVATHTDSPHLRVKPISRREENDFLQVNVECYGSGIWHTWFDRDLTLAGRVFFRKNDKIITQLVHIKRPILRIPNIAIHLQRDMNEKFVINKQDHLQAILSLKATEELNEKKDENDKSNWNSKKHNENSELKKHHSELLELISDECQCNPKDVINFDLMLADTQPACLGGLKNEFIFCSRLDNQMSSYCAIQGLIQSLDTLTNDAYIRGALLYDNEEIGSESAQGAMSEFTQHILLSADMAHAIHPNYSSLHDQHHKPTLHHSGVVIKTNCNNRYATTAFTSTIIKEIARIGNVQLQEFSMRNDMPCGTTVGPILSSRLGIYTIDVGAPQLSMHSIREMTSTTALENYLNFFQAFYKNFQQVRRSIEI
ncbi:unnamed protein product [Didymodactylos carnosus]|uniref:Aspartyl aminopeptidase n=1 Tax=Didymodactylos carnosus TaxID=1234261 RepID=A0A813U5T9_9BILA|nr:unnamed protein product [Didymodactylos carnosus]CAF0842447.1 unnamed protein product [Didymodactylos carnosus]CAF3609689.1 unnamed protein product [Didymodactylos carnosus]CAF3627412.1 unnamed protein product [Didymodactylos carnosus]